MSEHYDNRAAELMMKSLLHRLSEQERDEFINIINSSEEKQKIFEELKQEREQLVRQALEMDDIDADTSWEKFAYNKNFPNKTTPLWRYIAAACIILVAGIIVYFLVIVESKTVSVPIITVRLRGSTPAEEKHNVVLRLGNGRVFLLDNVTDGTIDYLDNDPVLKKDTQLTYPLYTTSKALQFDTLETLRGGYYKSQLSDGSRIWLSSTSKLIYPRAFNKKERRVHLEGKAYFEISKDQTRPFIVQIGKMEIQVLGTSFNVTAYNDQKSIKTALFEGSVKLVAGGKVSSLSPGEQAVIIPEKNEFKVKISNKRSAFTKNYFEFFNEDFETIMTEICTAYGYKVRFTGRTITNHWNVNLYRKQPFITTLEHVKDVTKITYTIESDSTVIIHK